MGAKQMTQISKISNQARLDSKGSAFQFVLADLLFLILIGAIIAFAFASKWTTSTMFCLAIVFGGIVGATFVSLVFKYKRPGTVGVWFFLAAILFSFVSFLAAAMILFMHCVAAIGFSLMPKRWITAKLLTRVSMACVATTMLLSNGIEPSRLQNLRQAQAEYPIVDLSDRLYEQGIRNAVNSPEQEIAVSNKVNMRLSENESFAAAGRYWRLDALEKIHEQKYEEFVRSVGFGAVRMMSFSIYQIKTPEIPTITFDIELAEYDLEANNEQDAISWAEHLRVAELAQHDSFKNYHNAGEADFLHPATFGFIKSPQKAAGFLPHAFHFPLGRLHSGQDRNKTWRLEKLELISLMRFDKPRAYVLDHLPRMDHLSSEDIPTRALTEFESAALADLQTQKDIVIREATDHLRMLGSLRAGKQCMNCHSVKRGELLGAFTYEFAWK